MSVLPSACLSCQFFPSVSSFVGLTGLCTCIPVCLLCPPCRSFVRLSVCFCLFSCNHDVSLIRFLSISPSVCLFVCICVSYLCVCPSVCPSVCLSVVLLL